MAKTIDEKIAEVQTKITQYKNREKQLLQKQKTVARKERTRHLIERGAIAENLIPEAETLTNEQFKPVLELAVDRQGLIPLVTSAHLYTT